MPGKSTFFENFPEKNAILWGFPEKIEFLNPYSRLPQISNQIDEAASGNWNWTPIRLRLLYLYCIQFSVLHIVLPINAFYRYFALPTYTSLPKFQSWRSSVGKTGRSGQLKDIPIIDLSGGDNDNACILTRKNHHLFSHSLFPSFIQAISIAPL